MNIRLAVPKDIEQLIRLRWDSTIEFDESKKNESYIDFAKECRQFLEDALKSGRWYIWVAEAEGKIVSNIYIELIQKVPRPGRVTHPFAYMTNVFTDEKYRNKGIGSRMLKKINEWVKEEGFEFVIVWPSDDAVEFYKRNGYSHCQQPMEFFPN